MEYTHTCRNCRWSRPRLGGSGDLDCMVSPPVVADDPLGSFWPGVRPDDYCRFFAQDPEMDAEGVAAAITEKEADHET